MKDYRQFDALHVDGENIAIDVLYTAGGVWLEINGAAWDGGKKTVAGFFYKDPQGIISKAVRLRADLRAWCPIRVYDCRGVLVQVIESPQAKADLCRKEG